MGEGTTSQDAGINWVIVVIGALILAAAVAAFEGVMVRVLAAVFILAATVYMARPREEQLVDNPLLEQLRDQKPGLDRRKYGRLRQHTERLLDHVRQMNRIAVDGRAGKVAPRHAHAEMDRLAALMRDIVEEIRKAAGVPTPVQEPGEQRKSQPQIVLPKGQRDQGSGSAAPGAETDAGGEPPGGRDRMLD